MRVISFERFHLDQRFISRWMIFISLIVLCLVLARWTWIWFAPAVETRTGLATLPLATVDHASRLFGGMPSTGAVVNTVTNSSTSTGIRLLGVIAATEGRRGYALVQLDTKEIIALQQGEEISPGLRLVKVEAKHIILERGDLQETLTWMDKKTLPGK